IACAAVLRSPFFAVSDVELFQIAHHRSERRHDANDPGALWQQFERYAILSEQTHLLRARAHLRTNLALAGRTSSTLLIENIYAETGIVATLNSGPNGDQKIA